MTQSSSLNRTEARASSGFFFCNCCSSAILVRAAITSCSNAYKRSPIVPLLEMTPKPALNTSDHFQCFFRHIAHMKYGMDTFTRTGTSSLSGLGRLMSTPTRIDTGKLCPYKICDQYSATPRTKPNEKLGILHTSSEVFFFQNRPDYIDLDMCSRFHPFQLIPISTHGAAFIAPRYVFCP